MTGVKHFFDQLAANGGSFFKILGEYNGWEEGMTVVSAFLKIRSNGASENIPNRATRLACVTLPAKPGKP